MGALTLKIFPFELRGWDIEKFRSFDPTDGFGSITKVYIHKNLIVQIEPDYNNYNFNTWLHDKGRQYFDSILKTWFEQEKTVLTKEDWSKLFNTTIKLMYVFSHCGISNDINYFFTFVCDHLSLEVLNMLIIISQNCSSIALKKTESFKGNIDLEHHFQLNSIVDHAKLNSSTMCLLIALNPRYEGYHLNLKLRQRSLKGNFRCLTIGSLIDLTFPLSFLGSNFSIVKTITKGNNLICQDFKFSTNPSLIYSTEFLKRNDSNTTANILKMLFYSNIFDSVWNGLNMLSPSLSDVGTFTLKRIPQLRLKDLNTFSSLYFLNTTVHTVSNLKKITELKLLKKLATNNQQFLANKLIIDQNHQLNNNLVTLTQILKSYIYIPQNTFYENEQTFINVEGFLKRTTKLIQGKPMKNTWQILRKFLKQCKNKLAFLTSKDNQIIFFNSKRLCNFKYFLNFQYYATQSLTPLNFCLTAKSKTLALNFLYFKSTTTKIKNTKLKYWLDDFYIEGKDEYSQCSKTLSYCSGNLRYEFTNFQNYNDEPRR